MKTFSTLSKSSPCTLRSREYFLADPTHSYSLLLPGFLLFVTASPETRTFPAASGNYLFNSFLHFPSPCYYFLNSPSCWVHENPPVWAPKGSNISEYLEMETHLLDFWKGRAAQGVGIELIPALPFPTGFAAVTKCILMAQQ